MLEAVSILMGQGYAFQGIVRSRLFWGESVAFGVNVNAGRP